MLKGLTAPSMISHQGFRAVSGRLHPHPSERPRVVGLLLCAMFDAHWRMTGPVAGGLRERAKAAGCSWLAYERDPLPRSRLRVRKPENCLRRFVSAAVSMV